MALQVFKDRQGPIWPLGQIAVATPGVPVSIMSLVDSAFVNAPESPTSTTSDEYTARAQAILFMPFKAGAGTILAANTASKLVYVVRKPLVGVSDSGGVIIALRPGDPIFILKAAALNLNVFNLYEFYIDADTAADGMQVTALIQ